MHNDIDSPSELQVHGRPRGVTRFNRLPVIIGGGVVAAFLIALMVGLNQRQSDGPGGAQETGINPKLKAEPGAPREIIKDAPTGLLAVAKPEPPRLPDPEPPRPEVPTLEAPPLVPRKPAPVPVAAVAEAPRQPSLEEQHRQRIFEEMEKERENAWGAGTAVGSGAPSGSQIGGAGGRPQSQLEQLAAQRAQAEARVRELQGMAAGQPSGVGAPANLAMPQPAMPGAGAADSDPNKQERKEQFLASAQAPIESNYVRSTRTAPISPYEVKAGWIIPAVMEHGINSDLPGQLTGRVTQNVYDSATGQHLLIPQGTRIVGKYDSQVAFGQERLLVVWQRLIFPDATSMSIGGMGGVDEGGYSGFQDQVNHHYARIFGFGLLTSIFSAAFQLSQPKNVVNPTTGVAIPSNGQVVASSVGSEMARLSVEVARKNLNIQPTIEIRPGYRFNVRVEKDLLLPKPYAYANVQ